MDKNTLKETIEKARRLKQEMTPGKWGWGAYGLKSEEQTPTPRHLVLITSREAGDIDYTRPADAEVIAGAPLFVDAVITLADRLDSAQREIARLRNLFNVTG